MTLRDITFPTPEENILFDEVLFTLAEDGQMGESLRFWESEITFIVLGKIGDPLEDLKAKTVREDNMPVLRRCSGGGTVVQGQGCLNYTLILSKVRPEIATIHKSYQFILGKTIEVLREVQIEAEYKPISDLALIRGEKKFSGNAQRRGKKFILHHGTLLYNFDLSLIERYLTIPKSIPEYRRNRGHEEFVTNIPLPVPTFKKLLAQSFGVCDENYDAHPAEQQKLESFLRTRKVVIDFLV